MTPAEALRRLARAFGVQTRYVDAAGVRRTAEPDALVAVLHALGAPLASEAAATAALAEHEAARARPGCAPVVVAWDGVLDTVPVRLPAKADPLRVLLRTEAGPAVEIDRIALDTIRSGHGLRFRGGLRLPPGYHTLEIETGADRWSVLVIAAPRRAPTHAGAGWGVFLPLHALRTGTDWGIGDYDSLERLIAWAAGVGASFTGTLPLLPMFLDAPFEPSPYAPVSRRFWGEVYIDVEAAPGFDADRDLTESDRARLAECRRADLVDYRGVAALKKRVLEAAAARFFEAGAPDRDFHAYVRERPEVRDYARFRAACDAYRAGWDGWPAPQRAGRLRDDDVLPADLHRHLFAAWLADRQLARAARAAANNGAALYLDLPLGVHRHGYDTWREPDLFVEGVAAGAPPDALFRGGQDWGFPPMSPIALRESGYGSLIATLRHHLRSAKLLRLDHVMSVRRLYWVPRGAAARDGVYVRYPAEEILAILVLEATRHDATLIGEDLGTVPRSVRAAMRRHSIQRMFVAQYEADARRAPPLPDPPPDAMASLNTHDMPPFAAYWAACDIDDQLARGWISEAERDAARSLRRETTRSIARQLGVGDGGPEAVSAARDALHERLIAGPAARTVINLEDLWLEPRPQNIPGTPAGENWRRKAALDFGGLRAAAEPRLHAIRPPRTPRSTMTEMQTTEAIQDVSTQDVYLFNEGTHNQLWRVLGAHPGRAVGRTGTRFAVWAPNAERVAVTGDFNDWDPVADPLQPVRSSGIWAGFLPDVQPGALYKYHIASRHHGYTVQKSDPFGFHHEIPPRSASVVWSLDYDWQDDAWMRERAEHNALHAPQSIYEVHLGSWRRHVNGDSYSYREIAEPLADYVRRMGFTHVEFLPVMEHPFFGSWGYQTTGYFAPSSRFGTPQDFMYLIDTLHQAGIGVILDWVPSHFPADEHGLAYFDGTHLFEHADPRQGYHMDWNSYIFNYGREEVRSFLLSSAMFWLDVYHADGLRVDAVASMLYLDYSRAAGEWIPNRYGGRENLEAIDFLRRLNSDVYQDAPGTQTYAEESTAWPMVSRPTYVGGLGFGMKWDMGWMHDTLTYISKDPVHRAYHHNQLTFRMVYAFNENFVLPLSHDEVVHGKGSLLGKMPGPDWQKFANLRLLYGYMFTQPGKKLLFMGGEFGQWHEWAHDGQLQWELLDAPPHKGLARWVADLNALYTGEPAAHGRDFDPEGFAWVDANDAWNSVLCYARKTDALEDTLLVVANFTPIPRENYRVGVPLAGVWRELLNSDAEVYGGSGVGNMGAVESTPIPSHGHYHSLNLTLPPLGVIVLKYGRSAA